MADSLSSYTFPQEIFILENNGRGQYSNTYRVYHDIASARRMKTKQINYYSYIRESDPERYNDYADRWKIYRVALGAVEARE